MVSLSLLLLVLGLYFYMRIQEKEIYNSSNELYNNEIQSLLKLNSESYTSLAIDATYWDEFVDFTKTKDLNWFNTSVVNLIDTYKLEYISVYDADNELITQVSTPKIKTKDIIPKEVIQNLLKKKVDKFYLKIPEGIIEVYGATIHPSDDPYKNKTSPSGIFFMVRLLDNEYFANIEKISSSNINFYTGKEKVTKTVYSIVPLKGYKGNVISNLFFKRAYNIDFWITKTILLIMAFAIIFSWFIYYFYANKWAKLPLSFIKKILKDGDVSSINALKSIKGEFRYIGMLFEENKFKAEQLKIAKIKAEESDKLKSSFLMNLSHEIRTPMNAIIGFTDLLRNSRISEDEKKEYLDIINDSGNNLVEIIDDLVEMSKIDSNLIKPNVETVNLEELLFNLVRTLKILNKNENVEFKFNTPKSSLDIDIVTDNVKLKEIISNLILNAFKFTNEGFVILDCEIDDQKDNITFSIQDSGIGILDEFKENAFKRFSKINTKGISANEGLGLGLAISKAYVEMLGGNISFQSQEGVGTTFKFSIPLKIAEGIKLEKNVFDPKTPTELGDEVIVLVAEDDNINFLLIEKIIKNFNCTVVRAKDGLEAVEFCKTNNEIDLVLMDIRMPNLDGYEAFKQIREFNKELPIIAQTSYSFQEELDKIKELGFNGFISKPLDKNKLYELIKIYLKK
ncbi:response regulator [Flavobacterium sp.]|uniref:response regulator n=1 Tax=Flavobacterium sp. TaxID=239 RepID=UPI002A7EFFCC|nr:response regulator [Flavobacterium sp.]